MEIVEQVMVEVVEIVARNLGSSESASGPVPTFSVSSTEINTSPTPAATQPSQPNTTQSPLLFFVALGFGVVFTNLWIIVGVKYCFRYNARNRALARGEDGEPINLENMPRPHRRRREKKLMSMDEVNERFPLTKYKTWVATRAREGLPTAGGVAVSTSKAAGSNDADGVTPSSPVDFKESSKEPSALPIPAGTTLEISNLPATKAVGGPGAKTGSTQDAEKTSAAADIAYPRPLLTEANSDTIVEGDKADDDDEDEDDHIHDALPPEFLTTPGDSCAICIDAIEEDDDIRGLTCGHAFHASCLDPWLTSRRACCPLCKADYFIPKPRPEGDSAEAERPRRSGRMNMPAPPGSAWTGVRGNPRMIFPGRFMSGPMHLGDDHHPRRRDRRATRQTRRTAPAVDRNQSLGTAQRTSTDNGNGHGNSAPPSRSLVQRVGLANPFRAGWMPPLRFPGRGRREQIDAAQAATSRPAAAELEEVVVQ